MSAMNTLLLGLVLFLGSHSVRIFAENWRTAQIARFGEIPWKIAYAVIAIAGFILIIQGYAMTRLAPTWIWFPPMWMSHLVALIMIPAFILLVAAYVPRNRIKSTLKHPMILSVKIWAFAHLISNGRLSEIILFGAFLIWSVLAFRAARKRDAASGATPPAGNLTGDMITVVVGLAAYTVFLFWLHIRWIGVPVFV